MEKLVKSKNLKIFFLILIVLLGVLLRTLALLQNSSLTLDESSLVINLQTKSYWELFGPLELFQQSPPFVTIVGKFVYDIFHLNEIALRFFSYLMSVVSLCFFPFLSSKFFKKDISIAVSTFMFAISPVLIFQAQIFKQYGADIFISILVLILLLTVDSAKLTRKKILGLTFLSCLGIWFSYSFFFLLVSVSLILLIKIILEKNISLFKSYLFFIGINLINIVSYYFLHMSKVMADPAYILRKKYWMFAYGFFPNTSQEYNIQFVSYLFDGLQHKEPTSLLFVVIVSLMLVLGVYFCIKNNFYKASILMVPIIIALIAGGLHISPFAHRLLLFLLPMFILILTMPLEYIDINKKIFSSVVVFLFVAYFSVSNILPFSYGVLTGKHSFKHNHIREFHESMKEKKLADNEIIYIAAFEMPNFRCYNFYLGIPENKIIYSDIDQYDKFLASIPKGKDVYFYLYGFLQSQREIDAAFSWMNKNCRKIEKSDKENDYVKCYAK